MFTERPCQPSFNWEIAKVHHVNLSSTWRLQRSCWSTQTLPTDAKQISTSPSFLRFAFLQNAGSLFSLSVCSILHTRPLSPQNKLDFAMSPQTITSSPFWRWSCFFHTTLISNEATSSILATLCNKLPRSVDVSYNGAAPWTRTAS